jgi:hypothetical protein
VHNCFIAGWVSAVVCLGVSSVYGNYSYTIMHVLNFWLQCHSDCAMKHLLLSYKKLHGLYVHFGTSVSCTNVNSCSRIWKSSTCFSTRVMNANLFRSQYRLSFCEWVRHRPSMPSSGASFLPVLRRLIFPFHCMFSVVMLFVTNVTFHCKIYSGRSESKNIWWIFFYIQLPLLETKVCLIHIE